MTESKLVDQVAEGARAFGELAKRYRPALVRFCAGRVGADDAEEAAQDALALAWQGVSQCRNLTRFKSWVWGIARHRCDRALRRRARHEPPMSIEQLIDAGVEPQTGSLATSREAAVAGDPLERVLADEDEREARDVLRERIAALPSMQRRCVEMLTEGMEYREIAAALGISPATARSHIRHARVALVELRGGGRPTRRQCAAV